ncbi:hypothetical protein R2F61_07995 [Mollicutes bacterium LVI A0078]|nr:hypothetical protein RZE84_07770 [Mollicutes bacterium LVI A0075]WOO90656.1 hypothetical protein R2F61_07995 [Mollicutes bacterium LVI A0078]
MVKKILYIFFLITILLLVIIHVYKSMNLTDLQKIVKKNGFEHFNSSQTIYDSYRWFEEDNEELFCNNLISIEVYDIYPTTITYSCVTLDEDGFTEFVYDYGTNTDKLSIGSGDFSHPSETVKDKELYEKVYNENFKDYNDKLVQELENYS